METRSPIFDLLSNILNELQPIKLFNLLFDFLKSYPPSSDAHKSHHSLNKLYRKCHRSFLFKQKKLQNASFIVTIQKHLCRLWTMDINFTECIVSDERSANKYERLCAKKQTGTILKKTAYQKCTSIQYTMSSLMSRLFKPKIYPLMMIQFIIFFNPFFYRPTVYAMKVQKCGAFTWHWLTKEPRRKMDNLLHNDEVISITVFFLSSFIFFAIPEETWEYQENEAKLTRITLHI